MPNKQMLIGAIKYHHEQISKDGTRLYYIHHQYGKILIEKEGLAVSFPSGEIEYYHWNVPQFIPLDLLIDTYDYIDDYINRKGNK